MCYCMVYFSHQNIDIQPANQNIDIQPASQNIYIQQANQNIDKAFFLGKRCIGPTRGEIINNKEVSVCTRGGIINNLYIWYLAPHFIIVYVDILQRRL